MNYSLNVIKVFIRKSFFRWPTFLPALLLFGLLFPTSLWAQPATGAQKRAAFRLQQKRISRSPFNNLYWRLTGPDNRSGRSTDVAGITGNPEIMYAAFASGGLWKTTDAGNHWTPLFDREATLSIGSIALAPSNPDILYVGTGEANIFRASLPGAGVYKSTDGGNSFVFLGLENTGTIARIVVHPDNPNMIYVAASGNEWTYNPDRGVYFSSNGGRTWKKILYEDDRSGCIDLVMDPVDPNILYASMWNRIRRRWSDPVPEEGDHLYKTTDGGKTWKVIQNGLPDTRVTGRIGLAVSHSQPNIVYAFVDDHSQKREPRPGETDSYERKVQKVVIGGVVYRSTDKGEHWEKMGEIHDFFKPFSGTYGWVFSQIRVHPHNPDEVYALGVSMARSADGGKTWKMFRPTDPASEPIHGDNHALWFDQQQPERMILGNDGGVSITLDGGKRWNNFFDQMPTTQFYTVTYDWSVPFNVFGAVQDEGTMSGSERNTFGTRQDSSVRHWMMAPGGEGTQIQVDPRQATIVYSSSYYGRLMKSDMSKSDSLRNKRFPEFDVGRIDSLRGEWLAATLMSRFNPDVVYHGLQHLYVTRNGGDHWQRISGDLSYNRNDRKGQYPYLIYHQAITALAEGEKAGVIYAGTDDGRLWLTQNDGASWQEITAGLPYNKHVAKLVTDPAMPGRIFAILNGRRDDDHRPYLYFSDDYGRNWKTVSGDLPASPANALAVDPCNSSWWYCGTDMGIYFTRNGGRNWACLNSNLPAAVSVNDLFIHPRDRKLVIGTYGRGVYILDDINNIQ